MSDQTDAITDKYKVAYREHVNAYCLSELIEVIADWQGKTPQQCLRDLILEENPLGDGDAAFEDRRLSI